MKILEVAFLESKSETVLARADIHFEGFVLKGFKVLKDRKSNKEYVTPPSYKAGIYWRPLFKTDSLEDWHVIQNRILEDYSHKQINDSMEGTSKS
jgi:hypothetical protein